ncbi:MAG: DUF2461 domain-containing protein [Bacteroidales bacterium]|nr:DUF2461 domain-containing protein [Bacteroidales bacterium]
MEIAASSFKFLAQLEQHNEREWFQKHKLNTMLQKKLRAYLK